MFERFDSSARRTLFLAKFQASAVGDRYIEPQHILAGLLRERDATTFEILRALNVDTPALELDCGATATLPPRPADDPRLSRSARRIAALARITAEDSRSTMISPYCLLLAILREPDNEAAKLLQRHGVDYASALDVVRQIDSR